MSKQELNKKMWKEFLERIAARYGIPIDDEEAMDVLDGVVREELREQHLQFLNKKEEDNHE